MARHFKLQLAQPAVPGRMRNHQFLFVEQHVHHYSPRFIFTTHFLVLAVTVAMQHFIAEVHALSCDVSGYCSLDAVSPFSGPLQTSAGLRVALAARSYKKEIIIEAASSYRIANALMSIRSLELLGLGHYLLIMHPPEACRAAAAKIPQMGCGWYTTSFSESKQEDLSLRAKLIFLRYQTLARAVRMGYNVLLLDTDVVVLHDPYVFLKAWPFNNFTVLNQEESYARPWVCNSGVTYVQAAPSNGVVAWIFAELVDRHLRLAEDGFQWRISRGFASSAGDDQDTYNDVLREAFLGEVLGAMTDFLPEGSPRKDGMEAYRAANLERIADTLQRTEFTVPADWVPIVAEEKSQIRWHWLKFPQLRNRQLPPDLELWPLYPEQRGNMSQDFVDVYMADCPSCPTFPDPLNISQADAAAAVPVDKIAWLPEWMGISWYARGRIGYWDNRTRTPPGQVLAHVHFPFVECGDRELAKVIIPCLTGHCHLDFKRLYFPHHLYYSSSMDQKQLQVVALSPSIDLSALRTSTEAWWIFHGLAQVGFALGRAVVWPDIPCNSSWLLLAPDGASLPLKLQWGFAPHGPLQGLKCSWDAWWQLGCMEQGRGLYTAEFQHFLSELPQEHATPSDANTILHVSPELLPSLQRQAAELAARAPQSPKLAEGVIPLTAPSAADMMVQVDAGELRAAVPQEGVGPPVLFLAHPVRVDFQGAGSGFDQQALEGYWRGCTPLNRDAFMAGCQTMRDYGGDFAVHQDVLAAAVAKGEVRGSPAVVLRPRTDVSKGVGKTA